MTDPERVADRLERYAKDQGGWHNIDDTCEEAAAMIRRLAAENESLTKGYESLTKENARLRAREARLVEALKPFADAEPVWDQSLDDSDLWQRPLRFSDRIRASLTVGDLRCARAAIEEATE